MSHLVLEFLKHFQTPGKITSFYERCKAEGWGYSKREIDKVRTSLITSGDILHVQGWTRDAIYVTSELGKRKIEGMGNG